jgi:Holliday junction DNA helicase RuvA
MISSVRGEVLSAVGSTVVVEVGGVGFSVLVPAPVALATRVGSTARLFTVMVVREDDISLYGFADADQLQTFDLLRGVTGVGPKSALGVLSTMTPDQIAEAIARDDDGAFRKVSGIGPKTAKLIVVSLAGKLIARPGASVPAVAAPTAVGDDVVTALIGLGWPEKTATSAVAAAGERADDADRASMPALLRLALAELGPAGAKR